MILTKDQVYRYMKQIVIPEISGSGQERILGSRVFLYSESLDRMSLALYYLAATGVGEVYCSIEDSSGWSALSDRLSDLNSDCSILLQDEKAMEASASQATTRIIIGGPGYVAGILETVSETDYAGSSIPTVTAIYNGWHGVIRTFTEQAAIKEFLLELNSSANQAGTSADDCSSKLSGYFSSLMAVIEHLKLVLSLGKPLYKPFYHNLSTMEFDSLDNCSDFLSKLNAPVKMPEEHRSLFSDSRILIVGCGGPGSTAAFILATLGIGSLGLIDPDIVELNNLNQQILYSTSRLGISRAQSSEMFLRQISPELKLDMYAARLGREYLHDIISRYDIIIGCVDNPAYRYVLNEACAAAGKPLLQAGAFDISGLVTSIIPGEEPGYRSIFPEPKAGSTMPSCSESGVLGPIPGLMGIVQAAEAVKLLTGIGRSLKNKILLFDVFDTDIYITDNSKNRYYELCAK